MPPAMVKKLTGIAWVWTTVQVGHYVTIHESYRSRRAVLLCNVSIPSDKASFIPVSKIALLPQAKIRHGQLSCRRELVL